jgi:hypothetical protein
MLYYNRPRDTLNAQFLKIEQKTIMLYFDKSQVEAHLFKTFHRFNV